MRRYSKVGEAAGIIGLGLQGAGMFGGGGGSQTQYYADPRSQYEADMIAFQSAMDSQRLGENILRGQIATQRGIDKYAFDLQRLQLDREMEVADDNVVTQYNMSLFKNSMDRMNNELTNYTTLAQLQQTKLNAQYQNEATRRGLNVDRLQSELDYKYSDVDRKFKAQQLGVSSNAALAEKYLKNQGFGIQAAGLQDQETNLGYEQQGLDLQKTSLNQKYNEGQRGLDTKLAEGDVTASLQGANAEYSRNQGLRELLRGVAKNEQEFAQYDALLGSMGQKRGVQSGQMKQDVVNRTMSEKRSLMGQYGQQLGEAGLGKSMNQADVAQGRRDLLQNRVLGEQDIRNQEGQLGLKRSQLSRDRQQLSLEQRASNLAYARDETLREMDTYRLGVDQEFDLMSKSLLPELRIMGQGLASEWNTANTNYSADLQKYAQDMNYALSDQVLAEQASTDQQMAQQSLQTLMENYELQGNSAIAAYLASMGNTSMQEMAGLNQLGAATYGVLSQLGGYSAPPPYSSSGGGGFNPSGLSGLFESAMGLFGGYPSAFSGSNGNIGSALQNSVRDIPSGGGSSGMWGV